MVRVAFTHRVFRNIFLMNIQIMRIYRPSQKSHTAMLILQYTRWIHKNSCLITIFFLFLSPSRSTPIGASQLEVNFPIQPLGFLYLFCPLIDWFIYLFIYVQNTDVCTSFCSLSFICLLRSFFLPLFSTVFPSNSRLFLSCRPFVVITFSTDLVGVEVTEATPTRPVENVVITTKDLQDRNNLLLDGRTVENKGKLILTCPYKFTTRLAI